MRTSRIHPELLAVVGDIVAETGERRSVVIAGAVRAKFRARAEAGDAVAKHLEHVWETEGWRRGCVEALAILARGTAVHLSDGKVVGMAPTAGVPVRDPETGKRTGQWEQKLLIKSLSWAEFEVALQVRVLQEARLADKVRALGEIAALRSRFPESYGPFEACILADIDPYDIDLGELVNG